MKPYNPHTDHPGAWLIHHHAFECQHDSERCTYCGFGKNASTHTVPGMIFIDDIRDPKTLKRKHVGDRKKQLESSSDE